MASATSTRAMMVLAAATLIVGLACGGDSAGGTTTGPGGGPQGSSGNAIKLGDTLARTFAAGARSDTLTLATDRVLRFHVDVQQTGAGTSGVLDFAVIDPTTGASITSGTGVPASVLLGIDPFSSPGLFHWYRLPHSGSFTIVVTIRAGVTYTGGYRIRLIGSDPAPERAPARLAFGDSVTESIDASGDVDEFTLTGFRSSSGRRLFIKAQTAGPTDSVIVESAVDPPNGFISFYTAIAGNDTRPFGASTGLTGDPGSDTLRIRVRGSSAATRATYQLKWLRIDEAPEGVSAALVAGDTVTSSLEFPGDIDTFTFTGEPGKLYALAVQSTSGRAAEKLDFYLSNSIGSIFDAVLPGNTPSLLGQMSHRFYADSGVKVRVSATSSDAYGPYRIVVIPIDSRPEHVSSVLTYGDTITEAIDYRRDLDEFTIAGTPGDTVVIFAQALSPDTSQDLVVMVTGLAGSVPGSTDTMAILTVTPGLPLRASGLRLGSIPPNGVNKVSVNGAAGIAGEDGYIGPYRLVVAKISSAPESANPLLQLNSIIVESGDPPGDLDHFVLPAAPGKQVSIYTATVPGSPPGSALALSISLPNGGAFAGETWDTLGVGGINIPPISQGLVNVNIEVFSTTGEPFKYRVWTYVVDNRPEHTSSTIHIGDTITTENIYPAADVDDFTLSATPGARFQACLRNREPSLQLARMQLLVYTTSTTDYSGNTFSSYFDTAPACTTTQTVPATGVATVRVLETRLIGGPYELRIVAAP